MCCGLNRTFFQAMGGLWRALLSCSDTPPYYSPYDEASKSFSRSQHFVPATPLDAAETKAWFCTHQRHRACNVLLCNSPPSLWRFMAACLCCVSGSHGFIDFFFFHSDREQWQLSWMFTYVDLYRAPRRPSGNAVAPTQKHKPGLEIKTCFKLSRQHRKKMGL